ncbi:FxsA family protein [Shimazuella alba]|uniref:FxsA family protein n=1 Tax=Shimazuella alba TaxID=2690964 RepID=A0A6I4VW93_9BACL|nr:FxsA family protein [Shimazuella alba]MXQ54116.1 FxsA family protein [Shimazuella alba]
MLFRKILQVMVVVFLVELVGIIWVGSLIGPLLTILLIVLCGVIGLLLIRKFGYQTFKTAQQQWSAGQPPGHTILKGVLLSLGAVLLVFPGFISDIIAVLLLIPFTRRFIQQMVFVWLRDRAMKRFR